MTSDRFGELARRLAARTAELQRETLKGPTLSVVRDQQHSGMDALMRDSHCRMIRHLRRRWGFPMQVVIDQAIFGLSGIEQLDDAALIELHRDLERAQDCMREGVSFEDAGLLRSRFG